jgi:hypothetical protein
MKPRSLPFVLLATVSGLLATGCVIEGESEEEVEDGADEIRTEGVLAPGAMRELRQAGLAQDEIEAIARW